MLKSKGAMFGLDARIALAIFGALSVISSAALYSAIQEARAVQVITQLNEVAKAFEAYYLDTGEMLPAVTDTKIGIVNLFESLSIAGWSGPYLPLDYSGTTNILFTNGLHGTISIWETGTWGVDTPVAMGSDIYCDAGDECSVWVSMYNLDRATAEAIDIKIDGEADFYNGKVRLYEDDDTPHVWIKFMNYDNR